MSQSPHLHEAAAAEYLGLSPNTLSGWRSTGKGPAYRKFGAAVRYSLHDLDAFSASSVVLL
jgi:hypothetical protein